MHFALVPLQTWPDAALLLRTSLSQMSRIGNNSSVVVEFDNECVTIRNRDGGEQGRMTLRRRVFIVGVFTREFPSFVALLYIAL